MPSTCRTARAAPAASTARAPTVARSSDPPRDPRRLLTNYAQLRAALGDPVLDPELLDRALTHRSYAYENGGLPTNERLEFLGDSVLGVVVTETLYLTHPDLSEGRLAKLRAAVVNARALAEVGRGIRLGEHVKLGRGEETTGGRDKASILSDTVEAVIGAVHLSGGIEVSSEVVHRLFDPLIEAASALGAGLDWKTSLQELAAEHAFGVPEYVIEDEGPDHVKTFTAQVRVGDQLYGNGIGRSKKEAEQAAAETAYGEHRRPPRHRRPDRRRRRCRRGRSSRRRSRRRRSRLLPQLLAASDHARAARGRGGPRRPGPTRPRRHHHLGRGAAPASGAPRPARSPGVRRPR